MADSSDSDSNNSDYEDEVLEAAVDDEIEKVQIKIKWHGTIVTEFIMEHFSFNFKPAKAKREILKHTNVPLKIQQNPCICNLYFIIEDQNRRITIHDEYNLRDLMGFTGSNTHFEVDASGVPPPILTTPLDELQVNQR